MKKKKCFLCLIHERSKVEILGHQTKNEEPSGRCLACGKNDAAGCHVQFYNHRNTVFGFQLCMINLKKPGAVTMGPEVCAVIA